jgi:hypothetical protein
MTDKGVDENSSAAMFTSTKDPMPSSFRLGWSEASGKRFRVRNRGCAFCGHPMSFHGHGTHECRAMFCRCLRFREAQRRRPRDPTDTASQRTRSRPARSTRSIYRSHEHYVFRFCEHLGAPATHAAAGRCSYFHWCHAAASYLAMDRVGHLVALCRRHQTASAIWSKALSAETPCAICRRAIRATRLPATPRSRTVLHGSPSLATSPIRGADQFPAPSRPGSRTGPTLSRRFLSQRPIIRSVS